MELGSRGGNKLMHFLSGSGWFSTLLLLISQRYIATWHGYWEPALNLCARRFSWVLGEINGSIHFKKTNEAAFWRAWDFCYDGYQQVLKSIWLCCLPRWSVKWEGNISNFNQTDNSGKGSQSSQTLHIASESAVNSHKLVKAITRTFSLFFLLVIQTNPHSTIASIYINSNEVRT